MIGKARKVKEILQLISTPSLTYLADIDDTIELNYTVFLLQILKVQNS